MLLDKELIESVFLQEIEDDCYIKLLSGCVSLSMNGRWSTSRQLQGCSADDSRHEKYLQFAERKKEEWTDNFR